MDWNTSVVWSQRRFLTTIFHWSPKWISLLAFFVFFFLIPNHGIKMTFVWKYRNRRHLLDDFYTSFPISFFHYTNRLHAGLYVRVKMALCLEAPLSSNADDRSCLLRLLSPMSASIPSVPAALMTFFLYLLFFFFPSRGKGRNRGTEQSLHQRERLLPGSTG